MKETKEIINGEHVLRDITTNDLKVLFDEYNNKYFGGRLPRCPLLKFTRRHDVSDTWAHFTVYGVDKYSIEMNLNNNLMWTISSLRNLLVHEMIHYSNQLDYGFCGAVHHLPPFITSAWWMNLRHKELNIQCHPNLLWRRERKPRKDNVKLKWWEWPLALMLPIFLHSLGLFIVPYALYCKVTGTKKKFEL